jgi:flavin reductase (DIM6/NTAB) family NADH-FMN oxidoreductase RutF
MGPNARSVLQALKRMDGLPRITTIAVGHGPLLRHHLTTWVDDYRSWSSERSTAEAYAAVCYLSQVGFCDRLSQAIARGIGKAGAAVQLVDLRATDAQELGALIGEASAGGGAHLAGQPPTPTCRPRSAPCCACKPKQWVGCYDAFSGDDEPIDTVAGQLRGLGQPAAFEPLRIRQVPSGRGLPALRRGRHRPGPAAHQGQNDRRDEVPRWRPATRPWVASQVASYVVTARQGDGSSGLSSAMVASWVSQASFEPPGLTVAVAKDRAIEALHAGGRSLCAQRAARRQPPGAVAAFPQALPPGPTALPGSTCWRASPPAAPCSADALAFLGCRVVQRLEGPDHWIIYAEVRAAQRLRHRSQHRRASPQGRQPLLETPD